MWLVIIGVLVASGVLAVLVRMPGLRLDSRRKQASIAAAETPREDAVNRHRRKLSGDYRLLHDYLEHRYADTVVLTFAQMEDLLGFKLPAQAHVDAAWWTGAATATGPCHTNAWTLARRTAVPNLQARAVVFERVLG